MKVGVIAVVVLLQVALALNQTKTLVVLDSRSLQQTHKRFFEKLEQHGEVTFAFSFDRYIKLKYYEEYIYDRIVLMCTSHKGTTAHHVDSESLRITELVNFFDSGRSVIVLADIDTSRGFRKLFYSFGLELDEVGSQLKDNFNNIGDSKTIVTSQLAQVHPFLTDKLKHGKIAYRGAGFKMVNFINHQLFALAKGEHTTYSRSETLKRTERVGSDITLVASVQGLNNARAVFTGSLDIFSDEFFSLPDLDNELLADNLIRWSFKESGILRVSNIKYYAVGKNSYSLYTCNDRAHYQLDIEEYNYRTSSWTPYIADDLAVEFVMLDPWVINRLVNHKGSSTYSAEFVTPSKAGIYQYKFIYERPGFNFIHYTNRVTVRPRKHDEFDRFLLTALPYYSGTFATIIGSLLFVVLFIYSKDSHQHDKKNY